MTAAPEQGRIDESRQQGILDAATQIAIIATDLRGMITIFNPGAERLLGFQALDMIGETTPLAFHDPVEVQLRARDIFHETGRRVSDFEVFVALAQETGHEIREWTYVHADGTRIPVRLTVTVIRNPAGEATGYLGMAVDIRDEQRAIKEANEAEMRLQSVLNAAVDGIMTIDGAGVILSANPAACRIFGYRAKELLGKPVTKLMPEPYRSEHDGYMRQYMESGRAKIIGKPGREVEGLRKDGSLVPLELAVSDIWLGDTFLFTGILRDITKRKAAEQALADANSLLQIRQARLEHDLDAAGEIQRHLLPMTPPFPDRLEIAWRFEPSMSVGGDIFNILPLGASSVGIYVLDVSGHGVDSSLLAVAVSQQLRPENGLVQRTGGGGAEAVAPPSLVVSNLDAAFPVQRFEKFMTLAYLVLDVDSGMVRYCNAGHPPPLLLRAGGEVSLLEEGGPVIGLGGMVPFTEGAERLLPGDALIFCTDGLLDYAGPGDESFGLERFVAEARRSPGRRMETLLNDLLTHLYQFGEFAEAPDDITLLGVRLKNP